MEIHAKRIVSHIRRLASRGGAGAPSPTLATASDADDSLLERFVQRRDESAFGVLVKRYGGLVLGVCRRVLGNESAAEDCMQAAFLVLARKAATIRRSQTLPAWLHGTAYRLALRCRRADLRRLHREARGFRSAVERHQPDPLDELSGRELLVVLEEEIQRLPESYRLPVVLCCLEGRSQDEAAAQLGWTAGSVKGRLERGRARLHARLSLRGLTLAAALAAVELSRAVGAAAGTASLFDATVKSAVAVACGQRVVSAGASTLAATLTEEVLKAMFMRKLAITTALVLAISVFATGAGMIRFAALRAEQWQAKAKEEDNRSGAIPRPEPKTPAANKGRKKDLSPLEKKAYEELAKLRMSRATLVESPGSIDVLLLQTDAGEMPGKALYNMGLVVLPILVEVLHDATPTAVVERDTRRGTGREKVWKMNEVVARLIWRISERDFALGKSPNEATLFWDLDKKPELIPKFKKLILAWYQKNRQKTQTQRKIDDLSDGWFRNRLDAVEWLGERKVAAAEVAIIQYVNRSLLLARTAANSTLDAELAESARALGQIGGNKSLPFVRSVCKHLVSWIDGPPGTGGGGIGYVGPDKLFMAYRALALLGAKAEAVKALESVYAKHKSKMEGSTRKEYEQRLQQAKKW